MKTVIRIMLATALLIFNKAVAQDFVKDYEQYRLSSKISKLSESEKRYRMKALSNKFAVVFSTVKDKTNIDMLACDSLYILSYDEMFGNVSFLVWNKRHSCFYSLQAKLKKRVVFKIVKIDVNADNKLKELPFDLRKTVEKGDTAAYEEYVKTHELPDGTRVSFTVAHKNKRHWTFISSKTHMTSQLD